MRRSLTVCCWGVYFGGLLAEHRTVHRLHRLHEPSQECSTKLSLPLLQGFLHHPAILVNLRSTGDTVRLAWQGLIGTACACLNLQPPRQIEKSL